MTGKTWVGRITTQTRSQVFQTLDGAFDFLLRLQKLGQMSEMFGRVF